MVVFLGTFSLWIHLVGLGLSGPTLVGNRPRRQSACTTRGLYETELNVTLNVTVKDSVHEDLSSGVNGTLDQDPGEAKAVIFPDEDSGEPADPKKKPFHEFFQIGNKTLYIPVKKLPVRKKIVGKRPIRGRAKYHNVTCNGCFKRSLHYLNLPKGVCRADGTSASEAPPLDMVMTILSRPTNRIMRDIIRGTWASATRNNTASQVRHVFLLGAVKDRHEQDLVKAESARYNDIVQQSFIDHYENLTYKMLLMHDWATTYCDNARFIFKVDEDVFVNVSRVLNITKQESADGTHLLGRCNTRSGPIRSNRSKWAMPMKQYNQTTYPPFCLGPRYLVPMQVSRAVLAVSADTPKVRLEDVYLGMLLAKTPFTVKDTKEIDAGGPGGISPRTLCAAVDQVTTKHGVRDVYLSSIWLKCYKPGQLKYMRGREREAASARLRARPPRKPPANKPSDGKPPQARAPNGKPPLAKPKIRPEHLAKILQQNNKAPQGKDTPR